MNSRQESPGMRLEDHEYLVQRAWASSCMCNFHRVLLSKSSKSNVFEVFSP